MVPSSGYVPLVEVIRKWGCSEDEVIEWAIRGAMNLWCFKPIPPGMEKKWCIVVDEGLVGLIRDSNVLDRLFGFIEDTTLRPGPRPTGSGKHDNQSLILVSPVNRSPDDLNKSGSWPRVYMDVDRSDLHLDSDEITMMEKEYPKLVGEVVKTETDPKPKEPNSVSQLKTKKETSRTTIIQRRRHRPVDILLNKNYSESVSPSASDVEIGTPVDKQAHLSTEIIINSKLNTQAEKQNRVKQPNNKREKPGLHIIGGCADPLPLGKGDKEPSSAQRNAPPVTGYLRLPQIIGNPKAGIPAIIPVSKSTWWAGVKSGRFPQPVKLSARCTAWKASDIMALHEELGENMK